MYPISALYTEYLTKRSREWIVKANIAGTDYDSSKIVDFEIENSLALGEEFELGSTILSKLTIRLKTSDLIAANAVIKPYLRLQLPASEDGANVAWNANTDAWQDADYPWQGGVTEWLQLGEFYIDNREKVNNIWVFTCYDKLVQADVPYISALTYPATMQDIWDEILTGLSFTDDSSVVIDPDYTISVGPAGYTKRQIMGYIASANAACVYISKDGIVRFRKFDADDTTVFNMTDAEYITAVQTNPEKSFTKIEVTYDKANGSVYTAGTGDENHTLYIENPFMTQAMTDDLLTALNGFSYIPTVIDARGYPQIEAGDRLRFGQLLSTTWVTAEDAWQDANYTWDGYKNGGDIIALHTVYSFQGGLRMSVEAQSKSEQQSEFQVDGTLSKQVNSIDKDAVKKGTAYFGLTITATEGLTVERTDSVSKVILNSDKLEWQVGGVRKLYYDSVDDVLKFAGVLTIEGGSSGIGNFDDAGDLATEDTADWATQVSGTGKPSDFADKTSTIIDGGLITTGAIQLNDGTDTKAGITAEGSGDTNIRIWAGDTYANRATAPFRVDQAGKLVATDAEITGKITAQSGTIGGWTIESDKLSGTGQIEGGTITGATIQTAASGARVVLNSSTLKSFDSLGTERISFSQFFEITFKDASGVDVGEIGGDSSGVYITGEGNDVNISAESGSLRVFASTTFSSFVNFSSATILGLGITDVVDLQDELNSKADNWTGFTGTFDTATQEVHVLNGIITSINSL